jgi:diguanylate cyclase (GGDEF)-like protein/PAS domain S-box-containing protein
MKYTEFAQHFNIEAHLLSGLMGEWVDFVCIKDGDGTWLQINESAQKLMNLNEVHFRGKRDIDLVKDFPNMAEFYKKCWETDEQTWKNRNATQFEEQYYDDYGVLRTFDVIKIPFYERDGSRKALLVLGKDITLGKVNEQELATTIKELADFKFALDQSSIVAITDHRGKITYVNDKFCEISKFSRDELIGKDHRILNSRYHPKQFFKEMWKTIRSGKVWNGEIKNQAKDGSFYWVKTTIIPFVDETDKPYQYIAIRQDITEQKNIAEQILYNAYHDDLTGLRNRRSLREDLTQWINEHKKTNQMALIFLDLNRFKFVNDTLGHNIGDRILQLVSKRLFIHLHEKAELYRFGGDEFIIVLKHQSRDEVIEFTREITSLFLNPFFIDKEKLYLTTSLGVSLFPKDGQNFETLVKKADSAMYLAKENGSNAIQFYTVDMYESMKKTMKMEGALRQAIDEEEFVLYYQPQIDLRSRKMIGLEALIRWEHPTLGMIPPSEFIPLAEETGLIIPISKWVLETACKQNKQWQENGVTPMRVAVNISSYLFKEDLVTIVSRILSETQLEPCYLELELTESIMQTPEIAKPILKELKELGVRLSIDDFGTGYSSLAYLRDFPIDSLKIDRSFVEEIQKDNGVIVKTIIDMASHLSVSVIAEGIETEDQLSFLSQLRCYEGQGFLFCRPLPGSELYKLLPQNAFS